MNSDSEGVVRTIAWRELFPFMLLFRSLSVAASGSVLALATVALVITPLGWRVASWLLVNDELRQNDPAIAAVADEQSSMYGDLFAASGGEPSVERFGERVFAPLLVFTRIVQPFWYIFRDYGGMRSFLFVALGAMWTILVWSFFGTAITRIAMFRYARSESLGLREAAQFAWKNLPSCAASVLIPLAGVAVLCIPTFLAGLLMTINVGLLVTGAVYFLVLGAALIMTLILLGLTFGWPLAVSAISAEGQESFDAMTRSFGYTFQKPLNYAIYALIAIVFGGVCWLVIARIAEGVESLSYWSTSWGANVANGDRIEEIKTAVSAPAPAADQEQPAWALRNGARAIGFWTALVKTVAVAFLFGQFWCLAAATYLLLRRDVDETETDEIFVSEDQRTFDLPPLPGSEGGSPPPPEAPAAAAETTGGGDAEESGDGVPG